MTDWEAAGDSEMAISMAPGVQIVVFEGTDSDRILASMATQPTLCNQLSTSLAWIATPTTKQLLAAFQVQGQSFFALSGDAGKVADPVGSLLDLPGVTLVGGTELTTGIPGGTPPYYGSEKCWASSQGWIANGDPQNPDSGIPYYQVGVGVTSSTINSEVSTQYRNVPDVALVANQIEIFTGGNPQSTGGTSFAAPLWAGFMALINEQSASNGLGPVGFANPVLYALAKSGEYGNTFTDIDTSHGACISNATTYDVNGNPTTTVGTGYNTTSGYDLVTGLGSPKCAMIDQLASSSPAANLHIAAGHGFACAVRADNSVSCWGRNVDGEMGNGDPNAGQWQLVPAAVSGLPSDSVVNVMVAGSSHTCALLLPPNSADFSASKVYCWGWNSSGQLGVGDTASRSGAVVVPGFQGALAIAAGAYHTCAIMLDPVDRSTHVVKCAGSNIVGQLGNGTHTVSEATPVYVLSDASMNQRLGGVSALVAGDSTTCALVGDVGSQVECWGAKLNSGYDDQPRPTPVPADPNGNVLTGVKAMGVRDSHLCSLTGTGGVECWGYNLWGNLGDGTSGSPRWWPSADLPVVSCADSKPLKDVAAISLGWDYSCALISDGTVQCWGRNDYGQLGDGTAQWRACAEPVVALNLVKEISAGGEMSCSLARTGVSCWGLWADADNYYVIHEVPTTVHFF